MKRERQGIGELVKTGSSASKRDDLRFWFWSEGQRIEIIAATDRGAHDPADLIGVAVVGAPVVSELVGGECHTATNSA